MFKSVAVFIVCFITTCCFYFYSNAPIFSNYTNSFDLYLCEYSNSNSIKNVDVIDYYFISGIKGESFMINSSDFNLNEFLLEFNAQLLFIEEISHGTSYYAFSPQIKYREQILGQTVNVQVFIAKDYVVVGAPIIYGSF